MSATLYALLSNGAGAVPELGTSVGLIPAWKVALVVGILAVVGLRDKLIFLAARGEVYGTLALTFLFPGVTMIVAAKLVMLAIWLGAATSKINHHFPFVVATMMSNNPLLRSKRLRRRLFRRFPDDLQPGWIPNLLAHGGTVIEFGVPLVLFFSRGGTVTYVAAAADDRLPPGDPHVDSAGRAARVERVHDLRRGNTFRRQGPLRAR